MFFISLCSAPDGMSCTLCVKVTNTPQQQGEPMKDILLHLVLKYDNTAD